MLRTVRNADHLILIMNFTYEFSRNELRVYYNFIMYYCNFLKAYISLHVCLYLEIFTDRNIEIERFFNVCVQITYFYAKCIRPECNTSKSNTQNVYALTKLKASLERSPFLEYI